MAQEKEVQSSYHLTEVKTDPLGQGRVDYLNIIQPGFLLPHFTLPDGFGKDFVLKQYIGRHHIIIAFVQRADHPGTRPFLKLLQEKLPEIQSHNGLLTAISVDHPKIVAGLVQELRLEFPLLTDVNQTAVRLYAVIDRRSVRQEPHPALFLADLQGVIRYKQVGLEGTNQLSFSPLLLRLREI
jgi:peroxiredoxin